MGPHAQGQVLREVEGQTQKSCDTDKGGCGRDQQVLAFLEGMLPAAFTLQLAWESHAESSADIRDTMATIQEVRCTFPPFLHKLTTMKGPSAGCSQEHNMRSLTNELQILIDR